MQSPAKQFLSGSAGLSRGRPAHPTAICTALVLLTALPGCFGHIWSREFSVDEVRPHGDHFDIVIETRRAGSPLNGMDHLQPVGDVRSYTLTFPNEPSKAQVIGWACDHTPPGPLAPETLIPLAKIELGNLNIAEPIHYCARVDGDGNGHQLFDVSRLNQRDWLVTDDQYRVLAHLTLANDFGPDGYNASDGFFDRATGAVVLWGRNSTLSYVTAVLPVLTWDFRTDRRDTRRLDIRSSLQIKDGKYVPRRAIPAAAAR
jgi:hypothetical protein